VHLLVFLFDRAYPLGHFLDDLRELVVLALLLCQCQLVTVHSLAPGLLVLLKLSLKLSLQLLQAGFVLRFVGLLYHVLSLRKLSTTIAMVLGLRKLSWL